VGRYTVEEGDSLLGIALALDSSRDVLELANGIEDADLIQPGQVLVVPPPGTSAQRADAISSLTQIAADRAVDPATLALYNGIAPRLAAQPIGREWVLLPPGAVAADPLAPGTVDAHSSGSDEFGAERPAEPMLYQVQAGDTLTDIAWRLGIDVDTLVNNNQKLADPDNIHPGDQLMVLPVSGLLYQVAPGDTLSGLVDRFGVDLAPVLQFNHLDNVDLVQSGTQLILPGASGFLGAGASSVSVPYRSQLDGTPWAAANCGPVSLGMGLASLGIDLSSGELRRQVLIAQGFGGNSVGTLIDALARTASNNGARTVGLYDGNQVHRWSVDDLRGELRARHPVIVQVKFRGLPGRTFSSYFGDHYIILTGLSGDSFVYNDPLNSDGSGYNRQITAAQLQIAMNATDRRWAHAGFALTR
jgi:LysM repeat protein